MTQTYFVNLENIVLIGATNQDDTLCYLWVACQEIDKLTLEEFRSFLQEFPWGIVRVSQGNSPCVDLPIRQVIPLFD